MSRRIEIELTSARPDGTWTWRAAGAKAPKGVLAASLLSAEAKIGDVMRAEVESELDGTTVLSVTQTKAKADRAGMLELIPSSKPFEGVVQTLAKRERGDRPDRGDRGPRGDRPGRPDGDRRPRPDGDRRPRPEGDRARPDGDRRPRRDGDRPVRAAGEGGGDRRPRPHFTPPPDLPQRPKPKRLKPGRAHRQAVLAGLPEEQRAVAERALQGGIPAVRQAVQEQNAILKAAGKEEIPAAGLIQMAEQLLPKLRVAEWLDRATAAKADLQELALPDLRSVVASAEDPVVARDESTRTLAAELKAALMTKQDSEMLLWLDDITAALGVGRVIRALKLSSQPPKAGVRLPPELATQLATAATGSLTPEALPERWAAMLEAAAFSPIRAQIMPTAGPAQVNDELTAVVARVAPALPQIAKLFGVEPAAGAAMPKSARPTRPGAPTRKPLPPKPAPKAAAPAAEVPAEAPVEVVAEVVEVPAEVRAEVVAEIVGVPAEVPVEVVAEVVEVPVEVVEVPVEVVAEASVLEDAAPSAE